MFDFLLNYLTWGALIIGSILLTLLILGCVITIISTIKELFDEHTQSKIDKEREQEKQRLINEALKDLSNETKKTVVTENKNNCGNSNDGYCRC